MPATKRGRSAASGRFIPPEEAAGRDDAVVETVQPMIECGHCSERIREEWSYCPHCGTHQRQHAVKPADV